MITRMFEYFKKLIADRGTAMHPVSSKDEIQRLTADIFKDGRNLLRASCVEDVNVAVNKITSAAAKGASYVEMTVNSAKREVIRDILRELGYKVYTDTFHSGKIAVWGWAPATTSVPYIFEN